MLSCKTFFGGLIMKYTKQTLFLVLFAYLVITSVLYINLPMAEDESNIYFVSQKWNDGHVPFKEYFGDSKAPGMYYYISAFIKITDNIQVLRFSIFVANLLSAVFVYLICMKLFDGEPARVSRKSITAAAIFLAVNIFPGMNGYFFINDRFLVLFSLISIYFFLKSENSRYYILASGITAGIATVFKQLGVTLPLLFILFYLCLYLRKKKKFKSAFSDSAILIAGFVVPLLLVALHFFVLGGLNEMIYWTSSGVSHEFNARSYILHPEEIIALGHLYQFSVMAPIWIPSLIISLLFVIKLFRRKISDKELFLLLWLVSNLHVLLLLLDFQASQYAVLSVMAAVFFIDFRKPSTNGKKILVYAALAFIILLSLSLNIYSEYNLQTTRHAFYNQEIDAANYVKERTIQGEPIYVFGYRPSIYILSQRDPPATVPVMANFNIQIKESVVIGSKEGGREK